MSSFAPMEIGPALCRVLGVEPKTVAEITLHVSAGDAPRAYVKHLLTDPVRIEEELWFLRADREGQRVRRKMSLRSAKDRGAELAERSRLVLDGWTIELAGVS